MLEIDEEFGEPGKPSSRWADTVRAEAFSDGVLAIIITLLVLDLRPPDTEPGRLLSGLIDEWPSYLAYVVSYLYVGIVWTNHKAAYRRIRWTNQGLHWVNLLVLFVTGLLPFPTAVVSRTLESGNLSDEQVAIALYALIGMLLSLSWFIFYEYLCRHPGLIEPETDPAYFPSGRIRALVGAALYALGGVAGYLVTPLLGLAIFLIIPIFWGLTSEGLYTWPMRQSTIR